MNFFDYFINYYIHQQFGPTYIITELISCLCIAFVFNNIRYNKWQDWLKLLADFAITFLVYLFLSCFNNLMYELAGDQHGANYTRFYMWLVVAMLHTIYPNRDSKYSMRFTFALATSTFIVYAITLSGTIGNLLSPINAGSSAPSPVWRDITFYVITLAEVGITWLLKALSPFRFHYVKTMPIVLVNIIFGMIYVLAILQDEYLREDTTVFSTLLFVFLLVIGILSYAIFYLNVKNYNQVIDAQSKALKAESERNQIEVSQSKYEELHQIKHDLKNQMSILETLVKEKKYDELEKYFADISENVHVTIDYVDCGNALVNTIVNMEMSKAKSLGIKIEYHISVPKELPIDAQDLTSFLTNLLDNALEAETRANLKDPIDLKILYDGFYLLVDVTNTFDAAQKPEDALKLHSSKSDRLNHGYGTKIIKNICKKYEGTSKFEVDKPGVFHFSGLLLLKEKKDE